MVRTAAANALAILAAIFVGSAPASADGVVKRTPSAPSLQPAEHGDVQAPPAAPRPFAYLLPATCRAAVRSLQRRGVAVKTLREDIELDGETHLVRRLQRADGSSAPPRSWKIETEIRRATRMRAAGSCLVFTDQAAGARAAALLEPQAPDGLAAQGLFGEQLQEGRDYPVIRLLEPTPLLTADLPSPVETPSPRKPLTLELLYGDKPLDFSGSPTSILRWLDDGESFLQVKDGRLYKVRAVTGRCEVLYQSGPLAQALAKHAGIDEPAAKQLAEQARNNLDPQATAALLQHNNDLYWAALDGSRVARLTDSRAPEELAAFSPDGRRVAFVREHDLYVVDVRGTAERRLTEQGSPTVRNGKADWVYFEEVYNRAWRAFRWSPDSQSIAFMQFDDAPVAAFTVVNPLEIEQQVETERFPLAGHPNPKVRLGVVRASGGDVQWAATAAYSPDNMLITHFGWTPDSKSVYYYVQDRTQRWLDVNRLRLDTQSSTTLLRERTRAWVDNPGDLRTLADSSFLWLSERDGWKHVYHYAADGKLLRRVTAGAWEVRGIQACDESGQRMCFTATKDSHLAENFYGARLDGSDVGRLTAEAGFHQVSANARGALFVDTWSDARHPTRVQLRDGAGRVVRVLDTNPVPNLERYAWSDVELVRIPLEDGGALEGSLIRPPGFDPRKKYPVWLSTYGGPHMPSLTDAWQGGRVFEQLLAQLGIIAFRCDPRSASGKGAVSAWMAYRQLGVQELRDLEEAVEWLAAQPFVDSARIGLSGHSYGGFLTAFALTHSRRFRAGIAGAPVTDWRNYDSIYTERYMLTPQENPDGYRRASVVGAAKDLHGRLLLIHGARDDNVHMSNTLQLAHALQQAGKSFEMMIYPPNRHGISGPHYRRLMVDFIRRAMLE